MLRGGTRWLHTPQVGRDAKSVTSWLAPSPKGLRLGLAVEWEAWGGWSHWLRTGRAMTLQQNTNAYLTPLLPLSLHHPVAALLWYSLHDLPWSSPPCLGQQSLPTRRKVVVWL